MELFGRGYVIEHCVAAFSDKQEKKLLTVYITDGLKCISETLQHVYGGAALTKRYIDLLDPPKEETRTAEEIIASMKNKMAAQFGGETA